MKRPAVTASFFLLLFLFYPSRAFPQFGSQKPVTLTGTVYTETGNHTVMQAYVRLCDSGGNQLEEFITQDSGDFSFRGIARGTYILQVSANGFESNSTHVDLSFSSDRGIVIYLKPTPTNTTEPSRAASVSSHEMSMPKGARDLVTQGKKRLYVDKNAQDALNNFQSAVAVAPTYYEAYYEIAVADLALGKKAEAEASLKKSIELSQDKFAEADVGLGTMMLDRGDVAQGEKLVRRGIELSPDYWLGHYELGRALFTENKIPDALKSADQAKSLAPSAPIVYRLLSNIHLQQKDYLALLADIDAYIKLDPDSPAGVRAKELREQVAQKVDSAKTKSASEKTP
ncbi:MAG: tetratricopeptide repeat protein [Candidatus Acidiferrales bacterium]